MSYGITISGVRVFDSSDAAARAADNLLKVLGDMEMIAVIEIWDEERQELLATHGISGD
jgi:hypothetical protein